MSIWRDGGFVFRIRMADGGVVMRRGGKWPASKRLFYLLLGWVLKERKISRVTVNGAFKQSPHEKIRFVHYWCQDCQIITISLVIYNSLVCINRLCTNIKYIDIPCGCRGVPIIFM